MKSFANMIESEKEEAAAELDLDTTVIKQMGELKSKIGKLLNLHF